MKVFVYIPETGLLRKTKQRTIQRQRKPDMTLKMITVVKLFSFSEPAASPSENSTSESDILITNAR